MGRCRCHRLPQTCPCWVCKVHLAQLQSQSIPSQLKQGLLATRKEMLKLKMINYFSKQSVWISDKSDKWIMINR